MLDRILADFVVAFHLLFIVFAVAGGLLVLRWRRVAWLHLPAVAWATLVELMHWRCPLTPVENFFRDRYGAGGYEGGFIDHYIAAIVYPEGLTPQIQVAIGITVFTINAIVYSVILVRSRRRRASATHTATGPVAVAPNDGLLPARPRA